MGLSAKEEVSIQTELTGTARSTPIQVEHFFRHAEHADLSHIIPFNVSEDVNALTWMDRIRRFCRLTVVSNHRVCSGSWQVASISHCNAINVPQIHWCYDDKIYLNHWWNATRLIKYHQECSRQHWSTSQGLNKRWRSLRIWCPSSNETVTVDHNKAFSGVLRKHCSVSMTKRGCPSPANHDCLRELWKQLLFKTIGFRQIVDVTHSDVANCCVFASVSYSQAFEILHWTYWNRHSVLNATHFRML